MGGGDEVNRTIDPVTANHIAIAVPTAKNHFLP